MTAGIHLHGSLGTHRRGRVLGEAAGARPTDVMPDGPALVAMFAQEFQGSGPGMQESLVDWTRVGGRTLLLLPPFAPGSCASPVSWQTEWLDGPPRGGEGLSGVLRTEVTHRITGRLQTPTGLAALWSDLSAYLGVHRTHPASGLFAVTTLPLWSLTVLDAPQALMSWLEALMSVAGSPPDPTQDVREELRPEHYGFLLFLFTGRYGDEEQVLAGTGSSPFFAFAPERAGALLEELQDRGLVRGTVPTEEAERLIRESPYEPFLGALLGVAS